MGSGNQCQMFYTGEFPHAARRQAMVLERFWRASCLRERLRGVDRVILTVSATPPLQGRPHGRYWKHGQVTVI
jgi:hypothetical protein